MLKSFCIKTKNKQIVNNLLNDFESSKLENLYISKLKFKFYHNFIAHYKGGNLDTFYNVFSDIFSNIIIKFYEKKIIQHVINANYFYFTNFEQRKIFDIVNKYIYDETLEETHLRKDSIKIACVQYLSHNKSMILDGFIKFRLSDYLKIIDYIVDVAVNKFVIDREYNEFIDLLKCYVDSKDCKTNIVHLIYQNHESTLLDDYKQIINVDDSILKSQYLSDITFSSNDYTLNILLTLLPQKIYIHLIDKNDDEFINTLKLIFGNKISLCNNCNICQMYRLEKINK